MIANKDRSGWIGASDTDKVIGNWCSKTWTDWWMNKLGIRDDHYENKYTLCGTHLEHRILESLGIEMELDKQILLPELHLRVNLDGNTEDTIYECKTFNRNKKFYTNKKYINQVQVQMFASGLRKAYIVFYLVDDKDYDNFFLPIESERIKIVEVSYDEKFINNTYLPNLRILSEALEEGRLPREAYYHRSEMESRPVRKLDIF